MNQTPEWVWLTIGTIAVVAAYIIGRWHGSDLLHRALRREANLNQTLATLTRDSNELGRRIQKDQEEHELAIKTLKAQLQRELQYSQDLAQQLENKQEAARQVVETLQTRLTEARKRARHPAKKTAARKANA